MKRGALLALLVGLGAALLTGSARAQQYPPPCTALEVDATVKVAGHTAIELHVCGVRMGSMLQVALNGTGVAMRVPVNAARTALSVPIPADASSGTYTLSAEGIDDSGKPVRFEVPITVLDPESTADAAMQAAGAGPVTVGAVEGDGISSSGAAVRPQSAPEKVLVASQRTPAMLKVAGLGLLGLLALGAVGAVAFTAVARARR